jgi:hypothetical protein
MEREDAAAGVSSGVGMIENNGSGDVVENNNNISNAVFDYDDDIMKKSNNDNDNGSQICTISRYNRLIYYLLY